MGNLELTPKPNHSLFRLMAIGTWRTSTDPSVYGAMQVEMGAAERYLEAFRTATGKRLTVSHMMAKAMGEVFERVPDANSVLRFNRLYRRSRVGVFFQVVLKDELTGEVDLSGATIFDPKDKSLLEIVEEFEARTARTRDRTDPKEKGRSVVRWIPHVLLNGFFSMISFLTGALNLNLTALGIPKDPFGSVMVTNIGSLGLEEAYAPLVPYSRVPMVVSMGKVVDRPVVRDGAVVPGRVMQLSATIDHRVLDGAHAAAMADVVRDWFEHPYERFGPIPGDAG